MHRCALWIGLAAGMLLAAPPLGAAPRVRSGRRAPAPRKARKAWLGTALAPLSAVDRRQKKVPKRGGVLVLRVLPRSPAARIGLRAGDVLMRLDRRYVFTPAELIRRILATPVGRTVQVDVIRNGQWLTAKVRLSARPKGLPYPGEAPAPPSEPATARQPKNRHSSACRARPKMPAAQTVELRRRVARLEQEVRRLRRLVQQIRRRR